MKHVFTLLLLLMFFTLSRGQVSKNGKNLEVVKLKVLRGGSLLDYSFLEKQEGKILIVEFWETWCAPCIQQMPHLTELVKKYPDDLKVVCVSTDDMKKVLNFVNRNSYPFDFVFDPEKKASKTFPHSSIPHTVLIDKNGVVQAETYPGYVSETIISQMISGKAINIPEIGFNPVDLKPPENKPSLVSFKLLNSELGEKRMSSITSYQNKRKIVSGYFENDYSDTIEVIKEYAQIGNILEFYQFAFGKKSESRFIFSNDLSFIRSSSPNYIYKLEFSVSNLFGEFDDVLIRQLNNVFGLETERLELDTTILVLKSVNVKAEGIRLADAHGDSNMTSYSRADSLHIDGNQISMPEFVKTIESCLGLFVAPEGDAESSYKINISLKNKSGTRKEWLELFEKQGVRLSEEKRKVEFIRIKDKFH